MAAPTPLRLLLACVMLLPAVLRAESGAYRVELLVLRHLGTNAVPETVDELRSFSAAYPLDGERLDDTPAEPIPLEVMSDLMENLWGRLGRSTAHEPLLFEIWEQSRIDYHPAVRVHGEETFERRPAAMPGTEFGDPGGDLPAEPGIPVMLDFFRVDGAVQLRRSRFLHLDLDLEYRVERRTAGAPLPASAAEAEQLIADMSTGLAPVPLSEVLVHRLQQSRLVRTETLNYFDTPYLGVLVRVTATAGE